jgi:conjugal transfer pilus assembly protein TraF
MQTNKNKILFFMLIFLCFANKNYAQGVTKIEEILYKEKNNYGLIVVGNSSCHYCKLQKEALEYFKYKYSWVVQEYDSFKEPSITKVFNVETTPSLFLIVKKNKQIIPIAEGYLPLKHLEVDVVKKIKELKGEKNISLYNNL